MKVLSTSTQSLSEAQEKALRAWLVSTNGDQLKKVVFGKLLVELSEASNIAMEMNPANGYEDKAGAFLKRAQRYKVFLEVFQEIIDQKESFSVIKIN